MNRYQEAYKTMKKCCCDNDTCVCDSADKIIKGLVERATPRKPINIQVRSAFMVVGQCPRCRWSTTNQNAPGGAYEGIVFCQNCGQAIDWTDWSDEV